MPKLPIISGDKAIKCLEKLGYYVVRQRGTHIRLHHTIRDGEFLTIPRHKILGKGLLRKLIRDAKISPEKFVDLLKGK